jgi:hypothetical protein
MKETGPFDVTENLENSLKKKRILPTAVQKYADYGTPFLGALSWGHKSQTFTRTFDIKKRS